MIGVQAVATHRARTVIQVARLVICFAMVSCPIRISSLCRLHHATPLLQVTARDSSLMTDPMTELPQHLLRLSELANRRATTFDITVQGDALRAMARALDVTALRKLRLSGEITPRGKRDWALNATLGATAVQDCVVTLEPVSTRIDTKVTRVYLYEWDTPTEEEVEMSADTDADPLPETLDLTALILEELRLALPAFPRAKGAELGEVVHTAPGQAPMRDEDAKPFAGLAGLRDALSQKDEKGGD